MDDAAPGHEPAPWRAALLVGALSAVLGLVTLGHRSLWFDETYDGVKTREAWPHVLHAIGATEMSQAAYLVGLKLWAAVTPGTDVWLRVPSVAAAAIATTLLVLLGARLWDRTTGILAGVLLAANALLVSWSQQARTYALVTCVVVLATLLFVRALDVPTRRNWLLYAVAAAAAVYCHFYAGFVVIAHLASLPLASARPPRRRVLETAGTFVALISVALYFTATAGRAQLGWIPPVSVAGVREFLDAVSGRNPLVWLAVLGGLAVLAAGARARRPGASWRLALVGGWIVLPVLLGVLVSLHQRIFVTRYGIVITPALALTGGVLIAWLARARREAAALALAAVVVVSLLQIGRWYRGQPENWRAAVAYLDRERRPGDTVVVLPTWAADGVLYYDPSIPLATTTQGGRTLVVVRERNADGLPQDVAAVPGTRGLVREDVAHFGSRVHVITLTPRS
jgi:mannosyltransferase